MKQYMLMKQLVIIHFLLMVIKEMVIILQVGIKVLNL